jgi:hypothetical protein
MILNAAAMRPPTPTTVRVNPVCRTCPNPPLTPDACPMARECFVNGPQASARRNPGKLAKPDGRGVRRVIRYEEGT